MDETFNRKYQSYLKKRLDLVFKDLKNPNIPVIAKNELFHLEDYDGNWITDREYDSISDYSDGYFLVEYSDSNGKYKYNFIDKHGKPISEKGFKYAESFSDGWALIKVGDRYNYINPKGELLTPDVWYEHAESFSCGLAVVYPTGEFRQYNYIDTNGHLLDRDGYATAESFHDGIGLVRKDSYSEFYNIIRTDGSLFIPNKVEELSSFHDGLAKGRRFYYNYLDKEGNWLFKEDVDKGTDFYKGHALVSARDNLRLPENYKERTSLKGNICVIDTKGNQIGKRYYGNLISNGIAEVFWGLNPLTSNYHHSAYLDRSGRLLKKWSNRDLNELYTQFDNFLRIMDHSSDKVKVRFICSTIDLDGYSGKKLKKGYDPIKVYGKRFVLCLKDYVGVYLYDQVLNEYIKITDPMENVVSFDDNFIHNPDDGKHYLIYNDELLDITDYYEKYLTGNRKNIINPGVEIVSKFDFFLANRDDIEDEDIINKRRQKEIQEKLKQEEEDNGLQLLKKQREAIEKQNQNQMQEALANLFNSITKIEELEKEMGTIERIKVDNIFNTVGDHKEIRPFLLEKGVLKHINLSGVSFKNVKISGIDFSGCNINLVPQEVYNKDLSYCNFEGIYISPMLSFNDVDIRGTKFSRDNDPRTMDINNVTMQDAIYDENTTYDGVSFVDLYGPCEKLNNRK